MGNVPLFRTAASLHYSGLSLGRSGEGSSVQHASGTTRRCAGKSECEVFECAARARVAW